jgi:hypothetical protein
MMTVLLEPGRSIWYRGEIIASNRPYLNTRRANGFDIEQFLHFLKLKWRVPAKLHNIGPDMAYFCIRRRLGGGKILYLDETVYRDNFIIDLSTLLTINCDPMELSVQSVALIPNLSSFTFKDKRMELSMALQANPGNMIYEKSLGKGEKLYIGSSLIIAMSESILATMTDSEVVLEGPGYVFLEAPLPPVQNDHLSTINILAKVLSAVMFFFFLWHIA